MNYKEVLEEQIQELRKKQESIQDVERKIALAEEIRRLIETIIK